MPYIREEDREDIEQAIANLSYYTLETGEYNFAITKLCQEFLEWLQHPDNMTGKQGYDARNTIIGLLECVKLEFYRRNVAAYEDAKREENGDVY